MKRFLNTKDGMVYMGDAMHYIAHLREASVDPVVTSRPFGPVLRKACGNVHSGECVGWFKLFRRELERALKLTGSVIIELGGLGFRGSRCEASITLSS